MGVCGKNMIQAPASINHYQRITLVLMFRSVGSVIFGTLGLEPPAAKELTAWQALPRIAMAENGHMLSI